ncbi:MAG: tail fiber domain-containing protein [Bacteroidota bacterium]|nr:tail fiber domain-containing protein [Bacteroidota bacterium]
MEILHLRSNLLDGGKAKAPIDLPTGQLAINYKSGYESLFIKNDAGSIIALNDWSKILNKPTSLAGYGIVDALNTSSQLQIKSGGLSVGNLLINTTTDAGYKLDVNGASRIFGGLHLNSEGWLNLYNGANTSRISISHNSASSKLDIYNRTTSSFANVELGFLNSETITLKNNQVERFIRSNAFGGAIRLRSDGASVGDRGIQLGRVDNNLSFSSQLAINGDSGNVTIGSITDAGYKLDVHGTGRFYSELFVENGLRISNSTGGGVGISLFAESSTHPNYGLMFARTLYKGTHGAVNGDWATYFTMSADAGRGWIFTNSASTSGGNVASISNTGNISASGEITAYSASDIRLKTEVRSLSNSLEILMRLNPVSYKWNGLAKKLNPLKSDNIEYGLIAQELECVMPELVHSLYDGLYKSVDYLKIIPHLICAVKQLKMELERCKCYN